MDRHEREEARAAKAQALRECRQHFHLRSLAKAMERWPLSAFAGIPLAETRKRFPPKLRRKVFDKTGALRPIHPVVLDTTRDLLILMNTERPENERLAAANRIFKRVRAFAESGVRPEGLAKGGRAAARVRHAEHEETKVKPYQDEHRERLKAHEKSPDIIEDMARKYDLAGWANNPKWAKKRMRDMIKPWSQRKT